MSLQGAAEGVETDCRKLRAKQGSQRAWRSMLSTAGCFDTSERQYGLYYAGRVPHNIIITQQSMHSTV